MTHFYNLVYLFSIALWIGYVAFAIFRSRKGNLVLALAFGGFSVLFFGIFAVAIGLGIYLGGRLGWHIYRRRGLVAAPGDPQNEGRRQGSSATTRTGT